MFAAHLHINNLLLNCKNFLDIAGAGYSLCLSNEQTEAPGSEMLFPRAYGCHPAEPGSLEILEPAKPSSRFSVWAWTLYPNQVEDL